MSLPVFCDACKAHIEWHLTHNGRSMPIDPEPHAQGRFYFGAGLKLHVGRVGIRPRMYQCHWDTCPKGTEAAKRATARNGGSTDLCDRFECVETGAHRHCFTCGDTEHFASDCPERDS